MTNSSPYYRRSISGDYCSYRYATDTVYRFGSSCLDGRFDGWLDGRFGDWLGGQSFGINHVRYGIYGP